MTKAKTPFIGFQVSSEDLARLDAIAEKNGCSRSEAARSALRFGAPLALDSHSIDIKRLILLLEYTQAAVDLIVHREHGDLAPGLEQIAHERMEEFHAPR
jgi:hypothetical protein